MYFINLYIFINYIIYSYITKTLRENTERLLLPIIS